MKFIQIFCFEKLHFERTTSWNTLKQLSHIFGWGCLKQDLAFYRASSRLGPNCPSYYWQFFHLLFLMGCFCCFSE